MQIQETAEQGAFRDRIAAAAGGRALSHATLQHLASHGALGVNVPEALGGAAQGVVAYALALAEVARVDAALAVTMAVTNMVSEVIARFGSPAQAQEFVPALVSGRYFGGAFALSEPGAGSDAAALSTRARKVDGRWRLTGQKVWITTGDQAGVLVVWARSGGEGARGISCFLVTDGFAAGKPEQKLGIRDSHTVALHFDDTPAELLGEEGCGFPIAMMALDGGRVGIAAQALGIARRARELCLAGGAPPELADAYMRCEAAWLLMLRAAWRKEVALPFSREAAMAKLFASEAANHMVRVALDLRGPEPALAKLLCDCRVTEIYEGTSEIQRLVIARKVLHD
jgi:alkylation response protein AidB-like acyl-CoA dehydrogenase